MLASAVFVPLYDTLGEDAVEFIIQHSKSSVIFTHAQKVGQVSCLVWWVGGVSVFGNKGRGGLCVRTAIIDD